MNNFYNYIVSRKYLAVFLSGFSPLLAALISQYGFGLHPCELCIYQRIPFGVIMVLGIVVFFVKNNNVATNTLIILVILALLANSGIAFYHVGVEQNWWSFGDCSGQFDTSSFEAFKNSVLNAPNVRCDEVQFSFLGISMAGWNFLYCLIVAIFFVFNYLGLKIKAEINAK